MIRIVCDHRSIVQMKIGSIDECDGLFHVGFPHMHKRLNLIDSSDEPTRARAGTTTTRTKRQVDGASILRSFQVYAVAHGVVKKPRGTILTILQENAAQGPKDCWKHADAFSSYLCIKCVRKPHIYTVVLITI
jgi:hypothetical protein